MSWKLSSITKLENGGYNLTYETPDGVVSVKSKSVVMTVPSHVASSLLRPLSVSFSFCELGIYRKASIQLEKCGFLYRVLQLLFSQESAANALSKLYYPPVAAVSVSYPKEAIRSECLIDGELKGFGQLHPRTQGVETLGNKSCSFNRYICQNVQISFMHVVVWISSGTIYSSSLFPNRAPPGRILLLNYIGGATNTGILSKVKKQQTLVTHVTSNKLILRTYIFFSWGFDPTV